MAGLGAKTPVSCLQEYLVSKKMIPKYDLIFNGVGTHLPKFTFRVQVGALWEEGTGRSKQEAKHRAAEKMLKSLKIIDDNDKSEEVEPNEFSPETVENYVGQLKDLCIIHRYPEPKYYLEEAAGPSHSRVFKMICCVSQLQDFGISKTKKQAKHQAAFKMLQRLREVGCKRGEEGFPQPESPNRFPNKLISSTMTDEEVTEKYIALKPNSATTYEDPAAYYKDHYKAYIGLDEASPTLAKLINDSQIMSLENALSFLQDVIKELEVALAMTKISTRDTNVDYVLMSMSVFPPIAAIGINENNAAFSLLNSLLILCKS